MSGALSFESRHALQKELDQLFNSTLSKLGSTDLLHIKKISRISSFCEWVGRFFIHFSIEPITYILGIIILWIHKQLEGIELGHSIQHGVYEKIPGAEKFKRSNYWWRYHSRLPLHAPSWRYSHNGLHHGHTNIVGSDPDARLYKRNEKKEKRRWYQRLLFLETLVNWPNIFFNANAMATGLFDVYFRRKSEPEILEDRSWKNIVKAHKRGLAGVILYSLREYVFFPMLAGPFYLKIFFANFLSSLMRNLFTAPVLYAGHISTEVEVFSSDKKPIDRAQWYEMQIRSTQNFEVPYFASLLAGGLDYQIEHHLCPKLPPNRLREIAPELRRICEKYGLVYNSRPWYQTLRLIFRQLNALNQV